MDIIIDIDLLSWLEYSKLPDLKDLTEEEKRIRYKKMLNEKQQSLYQKLLLQQAQAGTPGGGGSVLQPPDPQVLSNIYNYYHYR